MNYFFSILIIIVLVMFSFIKTRRLSIIIMLFLFLVLLTIYPEESIHSAKDGINLWIFVVMPSLFPFFIVSDLLISLRIPENIARLFTPIAKILFNTSGYGAYVFIMSIFSGYPTGAKITSELVLNQKITPDEGQNILTFGSTSGPLFIIGAVGAGMLKSTAAGYIIFICHIFGAIINGILYKFIRKGIFKERELAPKPYILNNNSSNGNIMSKAIANSLYTSGFIGGYIILFSVIIALLDRITFYSNLTNIFEILVSQNISIFPGILLKTSLEISNGCRIISTLPLNFDLKLILSSFIIAFSGLSIIGQVASIIGKTKINLKTYIIGKFSHGIISSLLCYLLLNINSFKLTIASNTTFASLFNYNIILLQTLLLIILLLNTVSIIIRKFRN